MNASAGGAGGKLVDAVELCCCFCDEAGRRYTVVTGGAVVEARAKGGDGGQIDAARVKHRVIESVLFLRATWQPCGQ